MKPNFSENVSADFLIENYNIVLLTHVYTEIKYNFHDLQDLFSYSTFYFLFFCYVVQYFLSLVRLITFYNKNLFGRKNSCHFKIEAYFII